MLAKLLLALIRIYQLTLSKLILAVLGPVCRFEPSCSRYAAACISGHGAFRGSLLSVKRLCKCHPFHPGGYDPPPPPPNSRIDQTTAVSTTVEGSAGHTFCLPDDGAIEKPR
jgi:putative membrane protein insertion efficiency factor